MKTLYESILGSTKSGKDVVIPKEIKKLIEELNSDIFDDSPQKYQFFKKNDLVLSDNEVKKLTEKIVDTIKRKNNSDKPKPELKKQLNKGVESFTQQVGIRDSITYCLIIGIEEVWGTSLKKEIVISIDEDNVYVLDTPETKHLVNKMNEYFTKNIKSLQCILFSESGKPIAKKSIIAAPYFKYDYKDMKKLFEA
jgi:hypothetical protein